MDIQIRRSTPAIQRVLGAQAFDEALDINDHGMPPGHPHIDDWQAGFRLRESQVNTRAVVMAYGAGSPP